VAEGGRGDRRRNERVVDEREQAEREDHQSTRGEWRVLCNHGAEPRAANQTKRDKDKQRSEPTRHPGGAGGGIKRRHAERNARREKWVGNADKERGRRRDDNEKDGKRGGEGPRREEGAR